MRPRLFLRRQVGQQKEEDVSGPSAASLGGETRPARLSPREAPRRAARQWRVLRASSLPIICPLVGALSRRPRQWHSERLLIFILVPFERGRVRRHRRVSSNSPCPTRATASKRSSISCRPSTTGEYPVTGRAGGLVPRRRSSGPSPGQRPMNRHSSRQVAGLPVSLGDGAPSQIKSAPSSLRGDAR